MVKKICENTELRRQSKINKETWIFKHLSSVRARWRSTKRMRFPDLCAIIVIWTMLSAFASYLPTALWDWGSEIEYFSFPYLSPVILCLCHFLWFQSRRVNKIIHLSLKIVKYAQPAEWLPYSQVQHCKWKRRISRLQLPIFKLNFFMKFIYTS